LGLKKRYIIHRDAIMRTKIMSNTIVVCSIVLITSYSAVGAETDQFNPVEPNRISEILTLISERIQSNYERIKTWQGHANFTSDSIYEGKRAERTFEKDTLGKGEIPNIITDHRESILDFSVDT